MASGAGGEAQAAAARIRFHVEPKRYSEALLELAQQANVTLIGAGACEGVSRTGLAGSMTLEEALDRLLADAGCAWKVVAPGAVQVSARRVEGEKPPPPVTVGELMVTATKRARDPRQLAVAVTAIPRAQLEATGSADSEDAIGQLAGVLATNLGPGRNKLLLRGLSDGAYTGRARSTVATYLDDLPLNYNAPDPDLRLVDVERVEVARGPQGALYGAGSMSGVYRIVTRKPVLDEYAAGVRATAAATTGGDPSGSLEGHVNVPLLGDWAALRLSAYEDIQGGYLDSVTLGKANVDRTERRGARLTLLVEPGADWSVLVTAAGQHLRSDDTHYTTPGLGRARAVNIPEPHVNDIELVSATVRRSWGWGELTSSSGYVRHDYSSLYDATATQTLYTDFAQTSAYSERANTRMLVQDLVLTSRGAGRLEWLAGLYASDTRIHSPTEFLAQNAGFPNVKVYGDDRRDHIRELAAYGELSYEIAPKWTVAVGGRAFTIDSHTRSDVVSERFAPRSLDRRSGLTGFSPKVSIQRQLKGGDLFYAVASEGYRSGGINSGGAVPLTPARETFRSDRLRNFEAGLKLEAFDRRVSLNTAVFYNVWKNIQTDQFRSSGILYTTNAGDARIVGLETELAWRVNEDLTVQLDGRVSRTRTSDPNIDFAPLLARGLPGAPAISGGALFTYQHDLAGDWRFSLVGETNYVGRSRVTFDYSGIPKMGGYVRAKLLAEFSRGNMGAQVFLTNPLDSFSDTFAFGNPFNPVQVRQRQITPQRPRTLGVTLFASF